MYQLVDVYVNRRKNMFSVRDHKTRKVIGHTKSIVLQDCKFIVQEGGRQRFLRTKQRNVHAWITGTWIGARPYIGRSTWCSVRYNPKKSKNFKCMTRKMRESEFVQCDWFLKPHISAMISRED